MAIYKHKSELQYRNMKQLIQYLRMILKFMLIYVIPWVISDEILNWLGYFFL